MNKGMNANELKTLVEAIQAAERLKAILILQNASDKDEAVTLFENRLKAQQKPPKISLTNRRAVYSHEKQK